MEQGPVHVMREIPSFVDYYTFDAANGVIASVSVFEDRTGVEESGRRLASWIEQTARDCDITPGEVSKGEVFAGTRRGS